VETVKEVDELKAAQKEIKELKVALVDVRKRRGMTQQNYYKAVRTQYLEDTRGKGNG
jgi:hypothetical protein